MNILNSSTKEIKQFVNNVNGRDVIASFYELHKSGKMREKMSQKELYKLRTYLSQVSSAAFVGCQVVICRKEYSIDNFIGLWGNYRHEDIPTIPQNNVKFNSQRDNPGFVPIHVYDENDNQKYVEIQGMFERELMTIPPGEAQDPDSDKFFELGQKIVDKYGKDTWGDFNECVWEEVYKFQSPAQDIVTNFSEAQLKFALRSFSRTIDSIDPDNDLKIKYSDFPLV